MKVILLRDIKKLGRRWEIREVPSGHARNFLFPQKLAEPATMENLAKRETEMAQRERGMERLKQIADRLVKENFEFKLKAGSRGEIFNSVTAADIKKRLAEKGYPDIREIKLPAPLKVLGQHRITAVLDYGIRTSINISIS